ncbi:AMP-binding protein [Streptomyces sp. cmx-4-9]|uniref:AMP-binding protein n=1 Tax=Streptomyces sp. cmx-4-9 TaxID=2790941 RepID=UPI00397EE00E
MTHGSESARSDRPPFDHTGAAPADTVLSRFERWAAETPGARAVIAGAESLTYGELDARAERVAGRLLAAGLPQDAVVAVGTARQAELLAVVLGILKAGAAYTVVDVDAPHTARRLLSRIQPFALLTRAAHQARLDDGSGLRVIRLAVDPDPAEPAGRPTGGPPRRTPGRTAAVLSTGGPQPRPVPVGHALLLAAYESWAELARLGPGDRHLFTGPPAVTAFAAGWTRALCSGGALVVPERAPWTPDTVRAAAEAERVTVLHTDPAGAAHLLLPGPAPQGTAPPTPVPGPRSGPQPRLRALRLLTVTGDRLHLDEQALLQSRLQTGVRLLNVHALTETAGTGTWFGLTQLSGPVEDPQQLSLIGTPFPGCRADLRDGELYLVPPGGGAPVPTGDLARLRDDGLLEFGGRIRDRITLDGRVLDPHALESVLRGHEDIGAAMVAAVPGPDGAQRLVAYLAPPAQDASRRPGGNLPDADAVRAHLADKVPSGDLPRAVVRLRALPRNRAGQEDRAELPQPPRPVHGHTGRGAVRGGKYGPAAAGTADTGGAASASCAVGCGALVPGLAARLFTDVLWPGSTDLTGVPSPWSFLFTVLYLVECLAFGLGVLFLFTGRSRMAASRDAGRALTTAAHLAVVYLLVSWWPQDNLYRLAAKQDWPRQAALVYTFNVPLMLAAAVLAFHVTRRRTPAFDVDD